MGGFPIEYQIAPDLDRLRLYGLTIKDVVDAVSRSNAASGGHLIHKGNAEYVVRGVAGSGPRSSPATIHSTRAARFWTWKTWS